MRKRAKREETEINHLCAPMTSRSKHAGFSEETLLLIQSVYMHNKNLITIKNNSLEKLKNNVNNLAYVIL